MMKEEYELERTRKELAAFKFEQQKEEEKRLMKKEMELKTLREEKEIEEEEERKRNAADQAVKEHMEKGRKNNEDSERREKEYQQHLRDDLKKSGLDEEQIEKVLEKKRPNYTRMARRWLSFETLNAFRLEYTMDQVRPLFSVPPHLAFTNTHRRIQTTSSSSAGSPKTSKTNFGNIQRPFARDASAF